MQNYLNISIFSVIWDSYFPEFTCFPSPVCIMTQNNTTLNWGCISSSSKFYHPFTRRKNIWIRFPVWNVKLGKKYVFYSFYGFSGISEDLISRSTCSMYWYSTTTSNRIYDLCKIKYFENLIQSYHGVNFANWFIIGLDSFYVFRKVVD